MMLYHICKHIGSLYVYFEKTYQGDIGYQKIGVEVKCKQRGLVSKFSLCVFFFILHDLYVILNILLNQTWHIYVEYMRFQVYL